MLWTIFAENKMKYLLFVAMLTMLYSAASAAEYRPHVQIVCYAQEQKREYSGVVFKEDKDFYHVLTCAHGTQDLDQSNIRLKCVVAPDYNTIITNIQLSSDLVRSDSDIDIGLVKLPKIGGIRIKPLKLADASLDVGTECVSYGYVMDKYIKNNVSTLTINGREMVGSSEHRHSTLGGKPLLVCSGEVLSGMSGGSLVYQNKIFGIQSAGDKSRNRVTYCPSDVICKFLGEEYGYGN
jgi:hypothetical protein